MRVTGMGWEGAGSGAWRKRLGLAWTLCGYCERVRGEHAVWGGGELCGEGERMFVRMVLRMVWQVVLCVVVCRMAL